MDTEISKKSRVNCKYLDQGSPHKGTKCVMDLDQRNEMIIFDSFIKQASFFEAAEAAVKICSSIKPKHHKQV